MAPIWILVDIWQFVKSLFLPGRKILGFLPFLLSGAAGSGNPRRARLDPRVACLPFVVSAVPSWQKSVV